jgi:valyl-tRNA synthetase
MEIPSKYNPTEVEQRWYNYWMEHKYFHSEPDTREPYTIVIPPPNVTGVLHMGHMLNNTIQDVLIRRARLLGKNACWVPGTDHASIATEAKVVAKLKADGIDKNDISREEFLEHAWKWKEDYGSVILDQLKKLGCSCDWNRTKFTMDEDMSEGVIKVFITLYNKGLIYRGYRMVNWDPEAKTTLSDEEVEYVEKQGKLYFINYKIEDKMLEFLEKIEGAEKHLNARQENYSEIVDETNREKEIISQDAGQNKKRLLELESDRIATAAELDDRLLNIFNRQRMKQSDGVAIAEVKDGVCQGCHMNIPSQMYNELQRGNSLINCPSCERLIYWEKQDERSE